MIENFEFHVKIAGRDLGCYDAIGVCTGNYDFLEQNVGETSDTWSIHLYPGTAGTLSGAHHSGEYRDAFYNFERGNVVGLRVVSAELVIFYFLFYMNNDRYALLP